MKLQFNTVSITVLFFTTFISSILKQLLTMNHNNINHNPIILTKLTLSKQIFLTLLSFVVVAFGQPAWIWWLGLIASVIGFAIFWRVALCYQNKWHRFFLTTAWFTAVQLVQLSWSISHPYSYIYGVYIICSLVLGIQFGILTICLNSTSLRYFRHILMISALWTIMEWMRLFLLSGYTWNPVGLALTGSIFPLQMASLWGIFGLSFWVIFVNLLALRAWVLKLPISSVVAWAVAALIPFMYGASHISIHNYASAAQNKPSFTALLVQPAFPAEEAMTFSTPQKMIAHVIGEWCQILKIIKQHHGKDIDLIVLPEFVVPYGTYSFIFPYNIVRAAFQDALGEDAANLLPVNDVELTDGPLTLSINSPQGEVSLVNNAFWLQGIANSFNTGIVAGLEDAEDVLPGQREYYSAAMYFKPNPTAHHPDSFSVSRYEKRVLVPMGEYFPFSFCKDIAAKYGIQSCFTCGKKAKVFHTGKFPFGLSICYEETFGDLTRENKLEGAELLVNLTSDVWYPNSRLPQQHFDHSRLRSVENGIPLIRACNTGVTGAVDSLGRTVALLGENDAQSEWISDSLLVNVPTYTYQTLYSKFGDNFIIGFCFIFLFLPFFYKKK